MAMMKKKAMMKKAQNGKMTPMQKLKKMYPSADTTAAGDTRFEEYNAYAPKKFLDKVNATDKAFDAKYGKGKPAVDKKPTVKKKAMTGMKMKKAQTGIVSKESSNVLSKIPAAGAMKKTKSKERSADGNYMAKTVTRETPEGKSSTTKTRRTVQGILRGAPSVNKYKGGGKMKKAMSGMKMSKKK
jgi:hypothetical protein